MPLEVTTSIDTFASDGDDHVANAKLTLNAVTIGDDTVGLIKFDAPTTDGADTPATTIYIRLSQLQSALQAMSVQGLR